MSRKRCPRKSDACAPQYRRGWAERGLFPPSFQQTECTAHPRPRVSDIAQHKSISCFGFVVGTPCPMTPHSVLIGRLAMCGIPVGRTQCRAAAGGDGPKDFRLGLHVFAWHCDARQTSEVSVFDSVVLTLQTLWGPPPRMTFGTTHCRIVLRDCSLKTLPCHAGCPASPAPVAQCVFLLVVVDLVVRNCNLPNTATGARTSQVMPSMSLSLAVPPPLLVLVFLPPRLLRSLVASGVPRGPH